MEEQGSLQEKYDLLRKDLVELIHASQSEVDYIASLEVQALKQQKALKRQRTAFTDLKRKQAVAVAVTAGVAFFVGVVVSPYIIAISSTIGKIFI